MSMAFLSEIAAATLIGAKFGPSVALAAGFGAFLGHLYPVWLKFRGGKAVATFLGVTLGFDWRAALVFAVVWLTVAFVARYSSLAGLLASLTTAFSFFVLGAPGPFGLAVLMTVLIFWKHRENIARLRAGTESKIGQKG